MNIKNSVNNADLTQIIEATEDGKQGSKTFSEVWKQIVPAGTIVMWEGSEENVPDGWALYDKVTINESLPSCYYIIKLPFQFLFGKETEDPLPINMANAKEVTYYNGEIIDSIEVTYNNGSTHNYGGSKPGKGANIKITDGGFVIKNLRCRKEDKIPMGFEFLGDDSKYQSFHSGGLSVPYELSLFKNGCKIKLSKIYMGVKLGNVVVYPAIAGILFDVLAIPKK